MSRINELVSAIARTTAIVTGYYEEQGLPQPSYDIEGPSEVSIPSDKPSVSNAHVAALGATAKLYNLLLGPKGMLMSQNRVDNLSLHGIYRFNFDKAFPVGSEATFEEISQVTGVNLVDTRRILRHAMTNGIFCEPRPGIVAHTAASRLIATNSAIRDFVGAGAEEATPAHAKTVDAIAVTAMQRIHLSRIGEGPVIDVGGGHGPVSVAIARQIPGLRFTVQDMEHVVAEGPSQIPAELQDRITFMVNDIRTPQPVIGAPVYFFRAVFHNWPDASCIEILRNQIPALRPGSRIIIHDAVMQEPGTLPLYLEKRRRTMDLNMLAYFGSRERTQQDWEEMVKAADERFELHWAPAVPGEPLKMFVLTWKG